MLCCEPRVGRLRQYPALKFLDLVGVVKRVRTPKIPKRESYPNLPRTLMSVTSVQRRQTVVGGGVADTRTPHLTTDFHSSDWVVKRIGGQARSLKADVFWCAVVP